MRLRSRPFYLTFLCILCGSAFFLSSPLSANADNKHYLIDFGGSDNQTTGQASSWNNVTAPAMVNPLPSISLVDTGGNSTSVAFQMVAPDTCSDGLSTTQGGGLNDNGTTASTKYPALATQDSFIISASGASCNGTTPTPSYSFNINGLDNSSNYDFNFYASRDGLVDSRPTDYVVYNGSYATTTLDAANNVNATTTIYAVTPLSGTVRVKVSYNSLSANYGYLGILDIIGRSVNQSPTADAGINQTITLPTHTVTLTGSGSDSDGTISSYAWTDVTSPSHQALILASTSATTNVTDLAPGTYTFRLTVTDNSGGTGTDDVNVTVNAETFAGCSAKSIVILGSSTAFGTGSTAGNSWVELFTAYLQSLNASNSVSNLAVSGYTTAEVLPTYAGGTAGHNITAATSSSPDAIIVNLPSNDAAASMTLSASQSNFNQIKAAAAAAHIPIWFSTTQPRNLGTTGQNLLIATRDWLNTIFGNWAIDFWTTLASSDGSLNGTYDSGDGIHVNNAGHRILYNRTVDRAVMEEMCETTAPTSVTISTPTAGTVSGTITLSGSATDNYEVMGLQFKRDGSTLIGTEGTTTSYSTTWDTTAVSDGVHTLSLVARDAAHNFATSSLISVTVANAVPTVSASSNSTQYSSAGYVSGGVGYFPVTVATPSPSVSNINTPLPTAASFSRTMKPGSSGPDVKALQVFLNTHGYPVSLSGAGSLGHETTYFGPLTVRALIRFQEAYASTILTPLGLAKGTGNFGPATLKFIKGMLK